MGAISSLHGSFLRLSWSEVLCGGKGREGRAVSHSRHHGEAFMCIMTVITPPSQTGGETEAQNVNGLVEFTQLVGGRARACVALKPALPAHCPSLRIPFNSPASRRFHALVHSTLHHWCRLFHRILTLWPGV